ncbi:VOC family protein [Phytohabitans aurantiacus]|uniref:VOC family protein n=1 Tax=Phytohabitans aurantiacus TaxID=3016789 RepID=UPI00248F4B7A|nr:VOC family protein [Phytohabitans aurantiacus]
MADGGSRAPRSPLWQRCRIAEFVETAARVPPANTTPGTARPSAPAGDNVPPLAVEGPRLPPRLLPRLEEGKVVKNRVHLDVRVGTGLVGDERVAVLEAECARLIPLGASRLHLLQADEDNESCLLMQDVEGNEFCLD